MNPNFVQEGMAHSLQPITSQRCSIGLRLSAGETSSSIPNSLNHIFMVLASCTGVQSCWNRKGPSMNCSYKGGSMTLSKVPLYAEASRVPFNGTKGLSPTSEKEPPHYNPPSPNLYTWHSVVRQLYRSPGNRQMQTLPSNCQTEKCDSLL